MTTPYAFDPTGTLPANRITGEQHIITAVSNRNYHFTVPTYAPFFADGMIVSYRDINNNIRVLVEGIDYHFGFQFIAASRACAKPIYGAISYLNLQIAGVVTLSYQTVGGNWALDPIQINEILSDTLRNPKITSWEQVANVPTLFPVIDHEWNLQDLVGMSDVKEAIENITDTIANAPTPAPLNYSNLVPTKYTIGLGNVHNFGIATDHEAIEGVSITKYMTPRAVRYAIDARNVAALNNPIVPVTGSSKTVSSTLDVGKMLRFTNSNAKTLVLNVSDDHTPNTTYHVSNRATTGNLTIVSSDGMIFNPPKGGTLILEPGDVVTLQVVSSNVIDIYGSTKGAA